MSTYIVRGTDPILRDAALDELVRGLLGEDDRTLAREDFTIPGALLFLGLVGYGAELAYRRVRSGDVMLIGALAAFYAATLTISRAGGRPVLATNVG